MIHIITTMYVNGTKTNTRASKSEFPNRVGHPKEDDSGKQNEKQYFERADRLVADFIAQREQKDREEIPRKQNQFEIVHETTSSRRTYFTKCDAGKIPRAKN
ncbi:MAG: hypothetical protein MZU97_15390 [Bacillus subtilis]|nr:hypothetical protein [Bacillus subtilis]